MKITFKLALILISFFSICHLSSAQSNHSNFKVIAFYTARNDLAHISFVKEANKWFSKMSKANHFSYKSTNDWNKLNTKYLNKFDVVVFLDTRPEDKNQREAFETYMKNGGAWMGFHFSAFALTLSDYSQNWDWYHNEFLGSGEYSNNTWRPTSAILKIEDKNHPVIQGLPNTITASPNEWYNWQNDLTTNPDIDILLSIDPQSFPLGTGPKPSEIWNDGYYPVVWTNKNYRMIYFNMGHNDMDYENGTNQTLSYTFDNTQQNKLIINSLIWLGEENN
ncbi:ThuA domain-containing protein [Chondrinema litorale]|uniref:ThuA domain-containing protein n=1 Tax=Chondrinema litorale TaxID=2994555 RepID=UPI002542DA57|nr:ThuA domain-containing protein [Chondrinema litorale]UZR98700.1 ThuA domain-containing protein [Chondrinema litorale]